MKNWKRTCVDGSITIIEALRLLDISAMQILLVIDKDNKLCGTVTDGDIRRGILDHINLQAPIARIMNKEPITSLNTTTKKERLELMVSKSIAQLPIIDETGKIIRLDVLEGLLVEKDNKDIPVILMLGGLGTRLAPLTHDCPKPMLKVGDRPILEIIVNNLKDHGFRNFIFCVNYKADIIQNYFQDGSKFDVTITYQYEDKKLGTAGALSLLKNKISSPCLVMNGDVITSVDFTKLIDNHINSKADITMAIRQYELQIPYGVVKTDRNKVLSIDEKPHHKFFVNAGIYTINPDVLELIPENDHYNMTTFIEQLLEVRKTINVFPIHEYWIDIGQLDDYGKAQKDFMK